MTKELWQLSAVDIVEGIQARLFSAESVMAAVIGRSKACIPQLNSIVDDYSADAAKRKGKFHLCSEFGGGTVTPEILKN